VNTLKIAAIIITYNRKEELANCVKSILNANVVPSIIIVDNGSTDGSEEFIKGKFGKVNYIKLYNNLGPAGGAEKGQRYAYDNDFDAVWMLDDDAEVHPNALENILKVFELIKNEKDKIFLTSVTYGDRDFSKPIYNILLYNHKTGLTSRMSEENYNKEYFKYNISPMLGLFVPRNVFENAGFFKGEYFGWYDDTEFVLRAQKYGFEGFAVPQSKISHPIAFRKRAKILGKNFTFLSGRPERMYYGTRNNIIAQREFLKNFNFYFIFLPIFIMRRFASIVFFYENKGAFLKAFARGIRDGLIKRC
jgi:GT2 family glycosyltransferase